MYFKACNIQQFKNIKQAQFFLAPGFNWLLGANGMGKTNILDAFHILALTKSHINRTDAECVQTGTDFYALTASLVNEQNSHKVFAAYDIRKMEKAIRFDEVPVARMSEHIGRIPIMSIFPDDIELVNETSEHRRKLIDATLSQQNHDYLNNILTYGKMLAQRNALLKKMQETGQINKGLIEAIDIPLCEVAQNIYHWRHLFFESYTPLVLNMYQTISQSDEMLNIRYDSPLHARSAVDILQQNLSTDIAYGGTRQGIHKDDIRLIINNLDVRKHGSQGQKKTLLCALKLAQAAYLTQAHHKPIILLDDIFEKLDNNRVHNILKYVDDSGSQVIITHTDEAAARNISSRMQAPSQFNTIKQGILIQ